MVGDSNVSAAFVDYEQTPSQVEEKGWDNHWFVAGIQIAMERVGAMIGAIERERREGQ